MTFTSKSIVESSGPLNLTVRSPDEYIQASEVLNAISSEMPLLCTEARMLLPVDFSFDKWAFEQNDKAVFSDPFTVHLLYEGGYVQCEIRGKGITFSIYGNSVEFAGNWLKEQEVYGFEISTQNVYWITGPDWAHSNVQQIPLEASPEILTAYPWMSQTVEEYTKEFFESKSSILILIGPPGTGKTSFLKSLLIHSKRAAAVTYEENLLNEDGMFSYFVSNDEIDMLIFEDADTFLGSRKDGNTMMHRFLNVSNGLVSPLKGKKIIFTTNLPDVNEIDSALMRPGRCFDVMHFRSLDRAEAKAVHEEVFGKTSVEITGSYTLAEITNMSSIDMVQYRRKVGFL